ncbi:hypothetical protein FHH43_05795 [Clostridium perfringens]|nr:hypothetical protein [Clostridium perfringens]
MKKIFIGILVVLLVVFTGVLFFDREEEILMANVVRKIDYGILVNYEDEFFIVNTSKAKVIDKNENEINVDSIKEGDKIEIFYNGDIEEGWPAEINKVYKVELL